MIEDKLIQDMEALRKEARALLQDCRELVNRIDSVIHQYYEDRFQMRLWDSSLDSQEGAAKV